MYKTCEFQYQRSSFRELWNGWGKNQIKMKLLNYHSDHKKILGAYTKYSQGLGGFMEVSGNNYEFASNLRNTPP